MIYAVVALSVTVLILLILVLMLSAKTLTLMVEIDQANLQTDRYQMKLSNMQNIVFRKFDYMLPLSDSHLELEQMKLGEEGK